MMVLSHFCNLCTSTKPFTTAKSKMEKKDIDTLIDMMSTVMGVEWPKVMLRKTYASNPHRAKRRLHKKTSDSSSVSVGACGTPNCKDNSDTD